MSEQKEKMNKSEEGKVSGGLREYDKYEYMPPPISIDLKGNSGKKEAVSTVKVWQCDVCGAINSTVKPTIVSDSTVTDLHICQQCESEGRYNELERKYGKVDVVD